VNPAAAERISPFEALTHGFSHPAVMPAPAGGDRAADLQARQGLQAGGMLLMIRYEHGSELTEMPMLHALPDAPSWLLGVANLHGMLTPVIDLAAFAGESAPPPVRPMLMVLSQGADAAGIVIDGLPRRLRWDGAVQDPAGTAPLALLPHVHGSVLFEGQLWFDLNCSSLLDGFERSLQGL